MAIFVLGCLIPKLLVKSKKLLFCLDSSLFENHSYLFRLFRGHFVAVAVIVAAVVIFVLIFSWYCCRFRCLRGFSLSLFWLLSSLSS